MLLACLGVVAFVIVAVILLYNSLVTGRNLVDEAWSGISVQLKRRHDLIPSLVNTVKGYATHEKSLLEKITALRSQAVNASSSGNVHEVMQAENSLTRALRSLFAVSENYPQLNASTNFMQLQEQLSSLENEIQMARRYYNGAARDQNDRVMTFPGLLIASRFGFKKTEYFELTDEADREVPEVRF